MFGLVVAVLFVVGAVAPLAAVRSWGRWVPSRLLLGVLWAGFALLVLRGAAGVADDAVRVTGLSSTGLTGLTIEQVTGTAHPSAPELWSGRATDAYFTIGGLLFGATALAYRRTRRPSPPAA
jgi:hypothetical protein